MKQTKLLAQAFDKLDSLLPEEQDTLASLLLDVVDNGRVTEFVSVSRAFIDDEERWQEAFARSTDTLDKLFQEAVNHSHSDKIVKPL